MKKLKAGLFFFLGFSLMIFSQEENKSSIEKHHQIGLSIGSVVKTLSNKDVSDSFQETFTYRYIKNNIAVRLAVGGFYQKEISTEGFDNNADRSMLTFRWGYEKQVRITKKWQYYYGCDLKYDALTQEIINQFTDLEKAKYNALSVNPLLGFQFRLSPHLLLQTEASLSFFYKTANYNSTNDDLIFNSFNQVFRNNSKIKGVDVVLPNLLFLVVEF